MPCCSAAVAGPGGVGHDARGRAGYTVWGSNRTLAAGEMQGGVSCLGESWLWSFKWALLRCECERSFVCSSLLDAARRFRRIV